jgi:hypothetical protein
MLPYDYELLAERLASIRSWAGDITAGNRCALVMGLTMKLNPGKGETTFRGVTDVKKDIRSMPFLDRLFVKAADVAFQLTRAHGPPDFASAGESARAGMQDFRGVVYLSNCWRTPREKLLFAKTRSGDHIDLWDGSVLEIYRDHEGADELVHNAERVLLWRCR